MSGFRWYITKNIYMEINFMTAPYFTIETFLMDDGFKLGKGVRDKDGYFVDVPVAVLGATTRNATKYDTTAFVNQIKGPDTNYYKRLTEGCLFGEWGHPFVDMNTQLGMERLLNLDPQKESHHIRSTKIRHIDELGIDVIMIDAKGSGPYGKYYDEAMLDPTRNLAHSLRGISKAQFDRKNKVTFKELISLVTFDAGVASGGFKHSSKRYMKSIEGMGCDTIEELHAPITSANIDMVRNVALEKFTNTELNDLFKCKKIILGTVTTGYLDHRNEAINNEGQVPVSVFHTFVQVKR